MTSHDTGYSLLKSTKMRVAVITEFALNERHGTGAQLVKLYVDSKADFHHLHMHCGTHGQSVFGPSTLLNHRFKWPLKRGQNMASKTAFALGLSWWRETRGNPRKLRMALSQIQPFDVAHVVIGHNDSAGHALDILDVLKIPYIVQVWDIYHPEGLDPVTMPDMARLIGGAYGVVGLTDTIMEELLKFHPKKISKLMIGRARMDHVASAPNRNERLRIAVLGRPYAGGLELLENSIGELEARWGEVAFFISGSERAALPTGVTERTDVAEFVDSRAEYDRNIAACHIGFLTGPHELNSLGRYSFPSRTADFFMAGLPLIAHVVNGSAARTVLEPFAGRCVSFADSVADVVDGVERLENGRWAEASRYARAVAHDQFDIDKIRTQLFELLSHAGQTNLKQDCDKVPPDQLQWPQTSCISKIVASHLR